MSLLARYLAGGNRLTTLNRAVAASHVLIGLTAMSYAAVRLDQTSGTGARRGVLGEIDRIDAWIVCAGGCVVLGAGLVHWFFPRGGRWLLMTIAALGHVTAALFVWMSLRAGNAVSSPVSVLLVFVETASMVIVGHSFESAADRRAAARSRFGE